MNTEQPLEYNRYFHIYNRGINGTPLFKTKADYTSFLQKYSDYIEPVAETFAWCLMGNHFHVLVRILSEDEIGFIKPKENETRTFKVKKKYDPTKQFSHLFNSHAKAFNEHYNRTGGLFETPFRRVKVTNESYFKELVFYIHYNPVKHGFVQDMIEYSWSSYLSIISVKPSRLSREKVVGWFNSQSDFIEFHKRNPDEMDFAPFDLDS